MYARQIRDIATMLQQRVDDLGGRLAERPGPHLNPAGFIYWHILRVWDTDLLDIRGNDDIWTRAGYTAALGYQPVIRRGDDGAEYNDGYGYTDADVAAIPYQLEHLNGYLRQLVDETLAYLDRADEAELQRSIVLPYRDEPFTPSELVEHTILHSAYHIGELQITRGLLGLRDE
jgi:hypothetical protein